jgi:hypothetical protein
MSRQQPPWLYDDGLPVVLARSIFLLVVHCLPLAEYPSLTSHTA